ncbi:MAG: DUF1287 domain-containing protein, partial [Prevotella sp.]|nr:DUF1287 domain-containing protein [Prevotella sp.]
MKNNKEKWIEAVQLFLKYIEKQQYIIKHMRKAIALFLFVLISAAISAQETDFYKRLSNAAIELTKDRVTYDPRYYTLSYPNGDVPADKGVCTDVIIRAYRKLGIDLQKKIHEDMRTNFNTYPKKWGMK